MAYSDELWAVAKKKCRLNMEDIALAKRLGLNPRSLIKNIPNKSEQWKAPVKDWLREIDAMQTKKSEQKQRRKEKTAQTSKKEDAKPPELKIEPEQT
ncbi:MAG: hypothetical protein LBU32_05615 [Clostridiales bacterium]|jgi:hypothetical protein|nr:hypothetical protein [Clostridiales bacterium]